MNERTWVIKTEKGSMKKEKRMKKISKEMYRNIYIDVEMIERGANKEDRES